MTTQRRPADATQAAANNEQSVSQAAHANQPLNTSRALPKLSEEQPVARRHALRTVLAGAIGAVAAVLVRAGRPTETDATTGSILYTSTNSPATIEGDNTGGFIGVLGTTNSGGGAGVRGTATGASQGVWGICTGTAGLDGSYGVYGASDVGVGVTGTSTSGGTGVYGVSDNGNSIGVYGSAFGSGGTGVYGVNSGGNGIGVYGDSASSSSNNPGVWGQNTGGGPAIVGFSPSGVGFTAVTVSGTGCFGGASGSGTGVFAYSGTGAALVAQAAGAGALAGYFSGPVYVTGSLTVLGAKSAAVKGADGSLRRMYSLESPESWFEDFGTGQLSSGSATVQLEPGFAGVVHGDNYRVFITPQGDSNGLYVSSKTPSGFAVHEQQGGKSSVSFDYRIVAKRKDIPGARLEHVDLPPVPEVPTFPTPPTPPPTPPPIPRVPATPLAGH